MRQFLADLKDTNFSFTSADPNENYFSQIHFPR